MTRAMEDVIDGATTVAKTVGAVHGAEPVCLGGALLIAAVVWLHRHGISAEWAADTVRELYRELNEPKAKA